MPITLHMFRLAHGPCCNDSGARKRQPRGRVNPCCRAADELDMAELVESVAGELSPEDALRRVGYLARQPILDRRGTVFAYELLFHPLGEEPSGSGLSRESRGTLDVLSFFGVERFTGGAWGFVNCHIEALAEELFEGIPPVMTVLEIPPCDEVPGGLVRECTRLKEMGFRLALRDYVLDDPRHALLPLVHHVKVDIGNLDSPDWHKLSNEFCHTNSAMVADNIHTHGAYRRARAAGVQYFQGF
jgi:c-di-GMP phosphodiesterase